MMTLSSATFGVFNLYTIETGCFRLDGGAMFGVVPKTLWSRHFACDEKNRIPLTARCLLIQSKATGRNYLVDTGTGHKFDKKFKDIYDLDFSNYSLDKSLGYHGLTASDVTDVIFTHLHFDHCGGAVCLDQDRQPALTFPNARHWVHTAHLNHVQRANIREKASFLSENINPIVSSGLLKEVDDDHTYEPGLNIEIVNGHTTGQQLPCISDGEHKLLFAADLLPTTAHLPLPWVMGFDIRPLDTFEEKKRVLSRCIKEHILLYLEHDPFHELIQTGGNPIKPSIVWSGTLNDL
ncbi:MAG: MBL fold metallo-hydrolase [Balneolales bacterium]